MLKELLKAGPMRSPCGDYRTYYLAKDVEVIHTLLPDGIAQDSHGHAETTELHYVVEGRVRVRQGDDHKDFSKGDTFAFPPDRSIHLIENVSGGDAVLLTVKFVSPGDAMEKFRRDKVNEDGETRARDPSDQDEQRLILGKVD